MLNKPTSQKTDTVNNINFVAILHDTRVRVKTVRTKS